MANLNNTLVYPLPEHPLRIDTQTWQRDSHDLFDYEAPHVKQNRFYTSRHSRVFRHPAGDVYVTAETTPITYPAAECLLNVKIKDGRYLVSPADRSLPSSVVPKKLWMIVRDLPGQAYTLQEADIIKLGRFKLRVKQLAVKDGDVAPDIKLDDSEAPVSEVTEEEAQTMQCRICLLDGGTDDDPLICPCQCRGSIKFVHVECLRHWINGRLGFTADQSRFFFKQQTCELCKHNFPTAVRMPRGERLQIVAVPKFEAPYIVLENVVSGNGQKGIHIYSMANKKDLKLGRGHESDVRIADVSISRYHATIRCNEGKFLLDDHESKFGTLIALRRPQPIDNADKFSVQVGRTVLNFAIDTTKPASADIVEEEVGPLPGGLASDESSQDILPPLPSQQQGDSCPADNSNSGASCDEPNQTSSLHSRPTFITQGITSLPSPYRTTRLTGSALSCDNNLSDALKDASINPANSADSNRATNSADSNRATNSADSNRATNCVSGLMGPVACSAENSNEEE